MRDYLSKKNNLQHLIRSTNWSDQEIIFKASTE